MSSPGSWYDRDLAEEHAREAREARCDRLLAARLTRGEALVGPLPFDLGALDRYELRLEAARARLLVSRHCFFETPVPASFDTHRAWIGEALARAELSS